MMASVESQSVVVELSINGQVLTRQRLLVTMLCPPQQALLSEQLEALADELESADGDEPSSGSPVGLLDPRLFDATGEQLTTEQLDRMLRMLDHTRAEDEIRCENCGRGIELAIAGWRHRKSTPNGYALYCSDDVSVDDQAMAAGFYASGDVVYSASDPDTPVASFSGEDCVERAQEYAAFRLAELERESS